MSAPIGRPAGRSPRSGADALLGAVLRYLAICDRTHAQVAAYLDRRGASPIRRRAILARLKAWGYLDDDGFALRWAHGRLARRPMGRARLEAELLAKGFSEGTVGRTLRAIYGERRESEMAAVLLNQRAAGRRRTMAQQATLLRRAGFEEETIESLLGVEETW